ncbi:hypothetical protein [Pseudofrankia sp. BMG5.37]|uniref:hypothetical protein n=1 Tax=Pseudofrankia sp. BMG5.37 TaxID=3050035 RepID=UPI002895D0C3|nr:hypothetical protein [Pseudofrankia sp. BMG5.37]MDT3441767.1 hypothetical protein [Pseudofrankia sp. BMG5.37]
MSLLSVAQDGVSIQPLSANAQNVIGVGDSAEWRWSAKAAAPGSYSLVLKVDIEQQDSDIPLESIHLDLVLKVHGSLKNSAKSWWGKFGGLVAAVSGAVAGLAGIVAFLLVVPNRISSWRKQRRLDKAAQEEDKAAREKKDADERYRQTGYL